MLEIPESHTLVDQLNQAVQGKTIDTARAGESPHAFTWFTGDPAGYGELLQGRTAGTARAYGGLVALPLGEIELLFGDGVNLRYWGEKDRLPAKRQLYLRFEDGTALTASVQMYGGIWAGRPEEDENSYHLVAKQKEPPLKEAFDRVCFDAILSSVDKDKLSAKAFLATEQRIPGLGNGVLQDILWQCRIHPKRKMGTLSQEGIEEMFQAVKQTLREMTLKGGRDTERDLFGCFGGYATIASKKTLGKPCPRCGAPIEKSSYLGGAVYFCPDCQAL